MMKNIRINFQKQKVWTVCLDDTLKTKTVNYVLGVLPAAPGFERSVEYLNNLSGIGYVLIQFGVISGVIWYFWDKNIVPFFVNQVKREKYNARREREEKIQALMVRLREKEEAGGYFPMDWYNTLPPGVTFEFKPGCMSNGLYAKAAPKAWAGFPFMPKLPPEPYAEISLCNKAVYAPSLQTPKIITLPYFGHISPGIDISRGRPKIWSQEKVLKFEKLREREKLLLSYEELKNKADNLDSWLNSLDYSENYYNTWLKAEEVRKKKTEVLAQQESFTKESLVPLSEKEGYYLRYFEPQYERQKFIITYGTWWNNLSPWVHYEEGQKFSSKAIYCKQYRTYKYLPLEHKELDMFREECRQEALLEKIPVPWPPVSQQCINRNVISNIWLEENYMVSDQWFDWEAPARVARFEPIVFREYALRKLITRWSIVANSPNEARRGVISAYSRIEANRSRWERESVILKRKLEPCPEIRKDPDPDDLSAVFTKELW